MKNNVIARETGAAQSKDRKRSSLVELMKLWRQTTKPTEASTL
ncbi:hypothetical protein [Bradyrhizobium elkanii]|nr:hypothetical protein [Bradyrhizobium elkanii]WLA85141.1 hypothetical protein QNJ99_13460 [Bradyrhizobium elkanii]